jgi:hypothetical protein
MTTRVNGHIIPPELVHMTETGRWGPRCRPGDLTGLPIKDGDDLALLDVAEMIRNTDALRAALARGEGRFLGLTHGKTPAPGLLDVDAAVMIAATRGQEALVLDYSKGEFPRVVATAGRVWVEVAQSFEDLLVILKMKPT